MKRALKVFAFAVCYVTAYFFVLFVLIDVGDFVGSTFQLRNAYLLGFFVGNFLMIGLLIYCRRKTRDRWIRAEAERWLAERSRPSVYVRRRKLWGRVLWIPSGLVLVVLLFLPEAAGLVSHLFCGRSVPLHQYRLKTPLTWIVASSSNSSALLIATKGIARVGLRSYWQGEEPISEMSFSVGHDSSLLGGWYLAHARILAKPTLERGPEKLTCWDIVPYADTRMSPMDPRSAEILCRSGQNDFAANFVGTRTDSAAFYDLLHSAIE